MFKKIIHKLNQATKNSFKGLKNAVQFHWAFQFELVILLIAIPLAFLIGNSAVEYILLISSVFFLLIMELINTAIETTVNRIGLEYDELSGLAKDLGSAAIFLVGINILITWGIILFYKVVM